MTSETVCEIEVVNKKAVQEVKSRMLENKTLLKMVNIFKVLGDPTRMRLLYALSQKELCVCDLATLLDMTHSAISHQLKVLRNSNLVKFRKAGKIVYYSLADEHVMKLIKMGVEHARE